MKDAQEAAAAVLGSHYDSLDPRAQKVARHVAARKHIARDALRDAEVPPTRGQRAADAVASFGGSWTFVGLFAATMLAWAGLNAARLGTRGQSLRPYPQVLLNLRLSMLAAIQARRPC